MKTEFPKTFSLLFVPTIDEGCNNLSVSSEKAVNRIDILSNLIPPAVVANPPPNKHKPRIIITVWGVSKDDGVTFQYALT